MVALKNAVVFHCESGNALIAFARHTAPRLLLFVARGCLTSEAVQGAALALECVHNIHSGDGLPACVLGVGHGITDHVLEEHLEHGAGLLVDEAGDALDTSTTRETADGWLGDALDVVAKDLAVTLGASLSESFTSLSTS